MPAHVLFFSRRTMMVYLSLWVACSMLVSTCGIVGFADDLTPGDGEGSTQGVEELGAGDENEGSLSEFPEEGQSVAGDDIPPMWRHCPAEPVQVSMFIHHTWDFSPNRDTSQMTVSGNTGPLASCPLTVHKDKVSMEDCLIPITNNGFVETDAGKCAITSSGFAVISLEEGSCQDGVMTVTIVEDLDPDAGYDGTMRCPNFSQPYIPVYPPSLTTREFPIQTGGMSALESMDPDISGAFKYDKSWTLVSEDVSFPEPEE